MTPNRTAVPESSRSRTSRRPDRLNFCVGRSADRLTHSFSRQTKRAFLSWFCAHSALWPGAPLMLQSRLVHCTKVVALRLATVVRLGGRNLQHSSRARGVL